MDRIKIVGGNQLNGRIPISGAKNAALPLMIASLLTADRLTLKNVPNLADVNLLARILRNHGQHVRQGGGRVTAAAPLTEAPAAAGTRSGSSGPTSPKAYTCRNCRIAVSTSGE